MLVCLAALCLPGAGSPAPPPTLAGLFAKLGAMPGFSARFVEHKTLTLLRTPLRSEGQVFFVPPKLMVRRVERPIASLVVVADDEVRFASGDTSGRISLDAHPAVRLLAETLQLFLAGDLDGLRVHYGMQFQVRAAAEGAASGAAPWTLVLEPLAPAAAEVIRAVKLEGRETMLEKLTIVETNGDRATMVFSSVDPRRRFTPEEVEQLSRIPGM